MQGCGGEGDDKESAKWAEKKRIKRVEVCGGVKL